MPVASDTSAEPPQRADRPCPVCGESEFASTFRAVGHSFERCRGCRFVRMADAPTTSALASFYHADQASAASARQDHDVNLRRFATILQAIERHRPPGRFLDVGCSIGTSLAVARDRGWQAIGLEPSKAAVGTAQSELGVEVRNATLQDAGFAPQSFDAVLMHHTLEHVEDPLAVVQQIHDVLAPGGIMYQSLPNHGSLKARMLGRHFGYGVTDEHLSHFTSRTLRALVRRAGFDVVSTATWSYRQDPRLLWDFCRRVGLQRWLERKCGVPDGESMDTARYIAYLSRKRWAFFVCNRVWPQRLCRWTGLGEDLHLIARRPG